MKVIQFSDGTYAVRRFSRMNVCLFEYMDLKTGGFWWGRRAKYFKDCLTRDRLEILTRLEDTERKIAKKMTIRQFFSEYREAK